MAELNAMDCCFVAVSGWGKGQVCTVRMGCACEKVDHTNRFCLPPARIDPLINPAGAVASVPLGTAAARTPSGSELGVWG
jgi:hypothetical protein